MIRLDGRWLARAVGAAFLLLCAAWYGGTIAPTVHADDPGAGGSVQGGTLLDQACADRTDPNEIIINYTPVNATLYIDQSLRIDVDICFAPDASVGVALDEVDGPTLDRFDVVKVDSQAGLAIRVSYYFHCHDGNSPSAPNNLEGHQATSVAADNYLYVALIGYDPGDVSGLGDNHGATQGPAHVQCRDLPSCSGTPGQGYCVGGSTHLAGLEAPPLTTKATVPDIALLVAVLAGAAFVAAIGMGGWWALRRSRS
jgi:hypothetical protein